jgi:hypothetical protein
MSKFSGISISNACAPTAGSATQTNHQTSKLWSLTQMGSGIVGSDARILSSVSDQRTDEYGNFQGETLYPVVGDIQAHPQVCALLKAIEWRAAVNIDGTVGLVQRKVPSAIGFKNSWQTSAESAMHSLVGNWGRVTSDHNARVYRFEALNLPGRQQPDFPDIDELINELLAEFVIDRMDHPVLDKLLNPKPLDHIEPLYETPATGLEEDEDDVY